MNILIVEDHPLLRMGLRTLIHEELGNASVFESINFNEAIEQISKHTFDMIVLDIVIPGGQGVAMIQQLRSVQPVVSILIYTVHQEQLYGLTYIRAGADGFVSKNSSLDEIKAALSTVAKKGKYLSAELRSSLVAKLVNRDTHHENSLNSLSPIEKQVTQLLVEGHWNKEIAVMLNLKSSTVSTYKSRIFSKLGVNDVIQLARMVNTLQN